jgi:NAD(P)H-dependent FMN reductase
VVLVAVPEYAGGVADALKNAFAGSSARGTMYRKPVAVISAATSGGQHARQTMAQTLDPPRSHAGLAPVDRHELVVATRRR